MSEARPADPLSAILRDASDLTEGTLEQVKWAESEIDAAMVRHPDQRDLSYHGFGLLNPTHRLMATEMVARAHYRELLARLATGQDTRPGTAAEVCCTCCEASAVAPLTSTAAGLYFRMWASAFPEMPPASDHLQHYEALEGSAIDDLEATSRQDLARNDRILGDISCTGRHHGAPVPCAYAAEPPGDTHRAVSRSGPARRHEAAVQDGAAPFLFDLPQAGNPRGPDL